MVSNQWMSPRPIVSPIDQRVIRTQRSTKTPIAEKHHQKANAFPSILVPCHHDNQLSKDAQARGILKEWRMMYHRNTHPKVAKPRLIEVEFFDFFLDVVQAARAKCCQKSP